ncbi:hypothetical protein HMPREF9120_00351 [Neisseria sp. oral taxon 020 str. F0370]|nr:hypothetical protein HMPREF9120_00351 [Neisseria sp. oral taxon 020 str. F0370]
MVEIPLHIVCFFATGGEQEQGGGGKQEFVHGGFLIGRNGLLNSNAESAMPWRRDSCSDKSRDYSGTAGRNIVKIRPSETLF